MRRASIHRSENARRRGECPPSGPLLALYGFQVGGLSDHYLPSWQANEDFVTPCFAKHNQILQAAASGRTRSLFATNPKRILSLNGLSTLDYTPNAARIPRYIAFHSMTYAGCYGE